MSQPPDAPDDPYRAPSPRQEPSEPPQQPNGQQPYGQQPYPPPYGQQPYPQPYGQQPYPQPYPQPSYDPQGYGAPAGPGRPQDQVRRDKPPSVVRLVQAMLAGAFLSVVSGAYAILSLDDLVAASLPDIEQAAADSGIDVASLVDFVTTFGVVALVIGAALGAGLWLLFAWLFSRGQGRVVGTVLGGINAMGSLFGLLDALDPVDLLLQLLSIAVVVIALVLLWLPPTSAWFRAVKAAGRPAAWG